VIDFIGASPNDDEIAAIVAALQARVQQPCHAELVEAPLKPSAWAMAGRVYDDEVPPFDKLRVTRRHGVTPRVL